jgi:hypothetical protein
MSQLINQNDNQKESVNHPTTEPEIIQKVLPFASTFRCRKHDEIVMRGAESTSENAVEKSDDV